MAPTSRAAVTTRASAAWPAAISLDLLAVRRDVRRVAVLGQTTG